jgi:hypothetical protein
VDHSITSGMRTSDLFDIDAAVIKTKGNAVAECRGWVSQARDAFVAFKQAWEALEFTLPVFLGPFHSHRPCRVD